MENLKVNLNYFTTQSGSSRDAPLFVDPCSTL